LAFQCPQEGLKLTPVGVEVANSWRKCSHPSFNFGLGAVLYSFKGATGAGSTAVAPGDTQGSHVPGLTGVARIGRQKLSQPL
jgi:hypothetical protein